MSYSSLFDSPSLSTDFVELKCGVALSFFVNSVKPLFNIFQEENFSSVQENYLMEEFTRIWVQIGGKYYS